MSSRVGSLNGAQLREVLATSDLQPTLRRAVDDALVSSAIDGWTPSSKSVALLIDFAAGKVSIDEYEERVLAWITG
jgi:hypothetical protein